MSYPMSKPEQMKIIFRQITNLVSNCRITMNYEEGWSEFCRLNKQFTSLSGLSWKNASSDAEISMLSRYNAISVYMAKY